MDASGRVKLSTTSNSSFVVTNTSGSTVSANEIGYIDAAGEYKRTTTAYLDAAWCVTLSGGANNTDIHVARRGVVTVALNGNCSAGDYLFSSTTAGQAQPQSYTRPELFAVALTANSSGAGGTCSALLLCNTEPMPIVSSVDIYRVSSHAATDFVATINGAPSATSVVYNAPSAGNENVINNASSGELGKARLYNSTRGTYRLIESVNTGTNTITTVSSTDAWADTDTIDIESPTVTSPGVFEFIEIDLSQQSVIPELSRSITVDMTALDSGGSSALSGVHSWQTFVSSSEQGLQTYIASVASYRTVNIPLFQRRFCYRSNATGAATKTDIFRIAVAWVAVP